MRSQRCRKEEGRARSVPFKRTGEVKRRSVRFERERSILSLVGGFCRTCTFLFELVPTCLFSLSRDGANALNCFTRDCETRETGLEGALRCSGLAENGERMASVWESDTRMYAPKEVRPFFFSASPLLPTLPFLVSFSFGKIFLSGNDACILFLTGKIEVPIAQRIYFHFSIEN